MKRKTFAIMRYVLRRVAMVRHIQGSNNYTAATIIVGSIAIGKLLRLAGRQGSGLGTGHFDLA